MKTRVLAGLIMAPFLVLLYFGGYVLMLGCLFVGLMGLREFYKGFHNLGIAPNYAIGVVSTLLLYAANLYTIRGPIRSAESVVSVYLGWLFFVVVVSFLALLASEWRGVPRPLNDATVTIVGIVYVVFFSFHVMLVDQTTSSILVWIIVLSAFGTDICAYFGGFFLGKHKLCPTISPKKTVEGSVAGILGAVLVCGLFGYFFARAYFVHCLVLGLLGGVFSQCGDLTASIFKRKMGIKDYGKLIPGHGGILDRFDSVLFTGPMVYYYIAFVIGL